MRRKAEALNHGAVIINPSIFAEVALAFETQEQLESHFPPGEFERRPLPCDGEMEAAKGFLQYRRRRGLRVTPLPDFHIRAHAPVEELTLLTRDATRYRTYFPKVKLITAA